jgi:hypothetical protein
MFDRRSHDVCRARGGSHRAEQRQIAGLGSARCKHDLVTVRPDCRGYAVARGVERGARPPSLKVKRAWIKITLVGGVAHSVRDLAAHRRRGSVVEVNSN